MNKEVTDFAERIKSFSPRKAKASLTSFADEKREKKQRKDFEKTFGYSSKPGTYSNGAAKAGTIDVIKPDGKVVNISSAGNTPVIDYIEGVLTNAEIKQAAERGAFDEVSVEETETGEGEGDALFKTQ